jgi:hypothetical protein
MVMGLRSEEVCWRAEEYPEYPWDVRMPPGDATF